MVSSIIIIIIIIIMPCHWHGYTWPSLATSPYYSSPLAGLQCYIPYPHIAAVSMFELVVLLLLGHMRWSTGVHHLWPRLCMSSCPACLVRLAWIVFVMGGRWPYSWCLVRFCCQDLFNIARNMSYLTYRWDLNRYYLSGSKWTVNKWQWRGI